MVYLKLIFTSLTLGVRYSTVVKKYIPKKYILMNMLFFFGELK